MCSPATIFDKIIEKVVDVVFQLVGRHVGFLIHYKRNLNNLEDEVNKLEEQRITIDRKVDEANTRGDDLLDNVLDWRNEVDGMRQSVGTFMEDKTVKENMQCFKFHFISRYRLSKQADKKMVDVKSLTEKGGNLGGNLGTISRPKPPPRELQFPSIADHQSFHSRDDVFKGIMEALKDSKVKMIGVYGTGGVGKTNMVEKVGDQVKKDGFFDEVVMAAVSQDANLIKIQGRLADRLNLKLDAETEVGRANQLWNRLNNGKKNLVILDDCWQDLDFKAIGIPIIDGSKVCKVVLTSRNLRVLKKMRVDKDFQIKELSVEEAWDLFKKKVGDYVDSHDQQLHYTAYEICRECQGLPIVILAVAAALQGKHIYAWEAARDLMKESMLPNIEGIDPKVYSTLKWSYDRLESEDAKSCFLLSCLFPEDAQIPIEDLARHYMARRLIHPNPDTIEKARRRVRTVVDTLKTSCLLLEGKEENHVKMHDVIRDVAISIARDDQELHFLVHHGAQEWYEKGMYEHCSAISVSSETIRELPNELVCPQLHTLLLDWTSSDFYLKLPDKFFHGMEKLAVLDLKNVSMLPVLPSSLAKLQELRMLCLNRCKLGDIAKLRDLKDKLEILSLWNSDIQALPPEVGELTRLRLLDLGNCEELSVIPKGVISKLSRLEELYIPHTFDKWEATAANKEGSNVSLDEITSLTRLTTLEIHIPNVMLLPKGLDLSFKNLIRFKISVGSQLYWDEIFSSRRILKLEGVPLKDEFNVLLDRAEVLYLYKLKGLNKVLHDRVGEGFLNLKQLVVRNCDDLEHLIGEPKGLMPSPFRNLTELIIADCRFKYLFSPSCARGLLQLQKLKIRACEIMEEVIGTEGEKDEEKLTNTVSLSQLKYLTLEGLPNLVSFYPQKERAATTDGSSSSHAQSLFNEKVSLPALENIVIRDVPNIIEVWGKKLLLVENFCQLRSLEVRRCEKLVNLVPSIMLPQLQKLGVLSVCECPMMEVIIVLEKSKEDKKVATIDNIILLPKLRSLKLEILKTLKSFCTSRSEDEPLFNDQVALPALEEVEIIDVPNITEIWDKKLLPAESFCQLKSLKVTRCEKLVNVVPSNVLPQLPNLEVLLVCECLKMEVILDNSEEEKKVTSADNMILLPKLRSLTLRKLKNLKGFCTSRSEDHPLFNSQVALPQLKDLTLVSCINPKEIHLWHVLADERCLNLLSVEECDQVSTVVLPFFLRRLQNLHRLIVRNCQWEREDFQLEELVVGEGQSFGPFSEPRMIKLDSMHQLTFLWNKEPRGLVGLQNLQYLVIKDCSLLRNLFTSSVARALEQLKVLYLRSCPAMQEVIATDEGHKEIIDEIVFPKLEWLILKDQSNLKSFCSADCDFNFPSPRKVFLKGCPKMQTFSSGSLCMPQMRLCTQDDEFLWNKEPRGLVGLQSLQYLVIEDCSLLRNLFTSSVARALEQLKGLYLRSCPAMQEVIATDEGHKEIIDEIVFPKLEWLILKDLSNLESFCSADCDFNFPSLKRVVLIGCPKMQTFSSGSLCMPQMKLCTPQMKLCTQDDESSEDEDEQFFEVEDDKYFEVEDDAFDGEWLEIDDLNKYLEQRLLKGEESPMEEARHDYGEEDDFSEVRRIRDDE